ncbi:DUF434 domain-containing protein [Hymenobacter busanensis]|uniref:DUF434 domain-containing protein n=1 Tax=Hymenobacter busanensis TaxID=2607656 RepID=A0A7L4ZUJ1_9BACT|nr:DUF434 domain-containing protein [Hymenobacter busanensis]KAA9339759.1 DUF434 domain-containing protein [Hymenobacter busanensis]QHJ06486.1 DUF434 domain-containing protein [Hymenobacter busanensis]
MRPAETRHRGPHPADNELFAPKWVPVLGRAVAELCWLLARGYPPGATLKLVGDRHALTERQRWAVGRAACTDEQLTLRTAKQLSATNLGGRPVAIDGFNLLITLETALSGGVVLRGRDGALRDLSSIHGTYRAVQETDRAIRLTAAALLPLNPGPIRWLLDQPVSNSGRLAARLRDLGPELGLPWTAEVVMNPDSVLVDTADIVVTSDSVVLDRANCWLNLAALALEAAPPRWLLDLSQDETDAFTS